MSEVQARLQYEDPRQVGHWLTYPMHFSSFKQAMDLGYDGLCRGVTSRIDVLVLNLREEWVSMGVFDRAKAEQWYKELEEAKKREKWH